MVEVKDLSISPGADAEALVRETTALVDDGRWTLWNEGKGLERTIRFKTFKTTWVSGVPLVHLLLLRFEILMRDPESERIS